MYVHLYRKFFYLKIVSKHAFVQIVWVLMILQNKCAFIHFPYNNVVIWWSLFAAATIILCLQWPYHRYSGPRLSEVVSEPKYLYLIHDPIR